MQNILTRVFALIICLQPTSYLGAQHEKTVAEQVRSHLDSLEASDQFSGVVLIAKSGKILFSKAYGYANLADSIANKMDTRFNLASMNKMFTGLAIMQLVQAGKLALHEKVGTYLPEYPNRSVRDSVSIDQLLTHTSGMGNFWEEHARLAKERFKTVADYLPLFVDQKLSFVPGSKFAYSNSGFMVLGLIIEKVTGEDYFTYVRKHIYEPADMNDTESYALDEVVPRLATGYTMSTEQSGQWKNNIWSNVVKGTPAGGGYSTAGDLFNFATALQSFKLLNKENTVAYTMGRVKYAKGKYGYGLSEEIINGNRVLGHTGGHYGIANELMILPELGYVVVILTNGEVENYWEASNFIKRKLTGTTPAIDNYFFTRHICNLIAANGYDHGIKEIKRQQGRFAIREGVVERIAFRSLFVGNNTLGIALFTLNADLFPESPVAEYNLAEAYYVTGNATAAIRHYERYLQMQPDDEDAARKLAMVRRKGK